MKLYHKISEVPDFISIKSIFFREPWLSLEKENAHMVVIVYDNTLQSIVPIKIKKKYIFLLGFLIYIPLTVAGEKLSAQKEQQFLINLKTFLRQNNICDVLYPPMHVCVFSSKGIGYKYNKLGILSIDLLKTEDAIFNSFTPTYRNEIRKTQKSNVTNLFGVEYLHDFYTLYKQTHTRQNLFYENFEYFNKLISMMENNVLIGVCKIDSEIEGCALFIYDETNAYYLFGGSAEKTIMAGSIKALLWNSFLFFKNKKVQKVILGGYHTDSNASSKIEGIQKFKYKFGAEIEHGNSFITVIRYKYYIYKSILYFYLFFLSLIKR